MASYVYVTDKSAVAGASDYYGFVAQGINAAVTFTDSMQFMGEELTTYSCIGTAYYGCFLDGMFVTRIEIGATEICRMSSLGGTWPNVDPWPTKVKECYCLSPCVFSSYSAIGLTSNLFLVNAGVQATAGLTVKTDASYR